MKTIFGLTMVLGALTCAATTQRVNVCVHAIGTCGEFDPTIVGDACDYIANVDGPKEFFPFIRLFDRAGFDNVSLRLNNTHRRCALLDIHPVDGWGRGVFVIQGIVAVSANPIPVK